MPCYFMNESELDTLFPYMLDNKIVEILYQKTSV
jgi:hypothetical protein